MYLKLAGGGGGGEGMVMIAAMCSFWLGFG